LLEVKNLQINESALTGESVPVQKTTETLPEETLLADRRNMLFSGTYATYGNSTGIVIATGADTAIGNINKLMQSSTELKTPLSRSLEKVGKLLTIAILIVSVILFIIGLAKNLSVADSILNAITLAVAAIPEGLPAIVTIALAIGVRRMARKNAIIRKLPAVETLGSTTIICTDKTGTLTRNEMTVKQLFVNHKMYELSGTGYNPEGTLSPTPEGNNIQAVNDLLLAGVLCNDASLFSDKGWNISGDPTEAALVVAGYKCGIKENDARKNHPRTDSLPFESENQYMATLHRFPENYRLVIKGAPEVILKKCSGVKTAEITEVVSEMASQGLRVLAVGIKNITGSDKLSDKDTEGDFHFLGLAGMIDPPRQEAISSIRECHAAGITVKMITGDHARTAAAIGKQLNIIDNRNQALNGTEFTRLDDQGVEKAVIENNVFARVAPEHKLKIVQALQQSGNVVAMTGDGVNDAPALKTADIGIAMGITGTDVSKEAADMILRDDNFASIVAAIREGRRVYDNLLKSLMFVLPTNLGLAVILIVSILFFPEHDGIPIQSILPVQALWINMITTVTLALPLAFELPEDGIMDRPPRKQSEPLLSKVIIGRTVLTGILMGAVSTGLFLYEYYQEVTDAGHGVAVTEAQTISVTSIVIFQIFYLIHCRSFTKSLRILDIRSNMYLLWGIVLIILFQIGFIYLPFMNKLFHSSPLNADAWLKTVVASSLIYPVISAEKLILRTKK
jgi:Ca2+-transporting ATPase